MKLTLEVNVKNLILTASGTHGKDILDHAFDRVSVLEEVFCPGPETGRRLHCIGRLAKKGKIDLGHVKTMERAAEWIFETEGKHEEEKA